MIELAKGESIRVTLKDSDGSFTLKYGKHVLSISTEWADSEDRKGVIYQLNFTQDAKLAQLAEDEEMDIKFMDGGSDPKADSDL